MSVLLPSATNFSKSPLWVERVAKSKSKSKTATWLQSLLGRKAAYAALMVAAGSGTGGYFMPDLPVAGPLMQQFKELLQEDIDAQLPGLTDALKKLTQSSSAGPTLNGKPFDPTTEPLTQVYGGVHGSTPAAANQASAAPNAPAAPIAPVYSTPENEAAQVAGPPAYQPEIQPEATYPGPMAAAGDELTVLEPGPEEMPAESPSPYDTSANQSPVPTETGPPAPSGGPAPWASPPVTTGPASESYATNASPPVNPASMSNPSATTYPASSAPRPPASSAVRDIAIATFNIQVFGVSKMSDSSIVDRLVQIIQQFDVVAIQEIRAKDDTLMPQFLQRINATGRRYDFVIGPRLGRTNSKEQYAFVFDTQRIEVQPTSVGTISDPQALFHRSPLIARFRSRVSPPERGFTFYLVNIHTDPDDVPNEVNVLAEVQQVMQQTPSREDDVIVLGDFNASTKQLGSLVTTPNMLAVVNNKTTNTRRTAAYDNLVFNRVNTSEYTGNWDVVDIEAWFQITRDQALAISDHLPVWATFSAYERSPVGPVASQPNDVRR